MSQRYITGAIGHTARPAIVVFEDITVRHLYRPVLQNLRLYIYDGEAVAILGVEGAGKSMLLACLQGLVTPMQGQLSLFGVQVPPLTPALQGRIGSMPSLVRPRDDITVGNYVRAYAAYRDVQLTSAQLDIYVHRYALSAELPVAQLSRLQQRLLALALALVHDPRLVLLDEPLAGLSGTDQCVVEQYVQQIQREGRTLLVTFTVPLADSHLSAYDVIVKLDKGRVMHPG